MWMMKLLSLKANVYLHPDVLELTSDHVMSITNHEATH